MAHPRKNGPDVQNISDLVQPPVSRAYLGVFFLVPKGRGGAW